MLLFVLQGLIDISKEKTKLGGKKDRLSAQLEKIQADMAKPDYSTKVPEEIQKQNSEKVSPLVFDIFQKVIFQLVLSSESSRFISP